MVAHDDALGAGGTATAYGGLSSDEKKVTINVTHVAERGSVSIDQRYPEVEVPLTATLTDGDATAAQISAATFTWTIGTTTATVPSYTPTATGTIKVVATYTAKDNTRTVEDTKRVQSAATGTNADAAPWVRECH